MSGAAQSCSDYETSVRGNFVMEREALRAACNNNIQQFLRGFNVAVWETCINLGVSRLKNRTRFSD